ncbi:LacI family transcriptional regulator [Photobacterium sanctipauli]|uniref:LacI family transcriptional regulator n=1 Tax=Photobacterium sanctipauli TaxID=1342794 RepID=A0A2T3NWW2_9GAMM|nr:LacI family DNA-binding transcriptional regulator [Photobacterium sanctipauli]PSW20746.1 LacI family transcriptional regulator [Photobacterium sanctipauli]
MSVMDPVEIPKATIKEAAERAGVSIASVSRALNNKPGISEKTRKRILDICAELNYVPNTSARELTGGHSNTIAISMGPHDFVASRYLGMLWPALSAEIRKRGQNLLPVEQDTDISKVSGAILIGVEDNDPRAEYLKEMEIPFVSIGCGDNIFWVAPDDFNGARLATEHLLERGCRQVAFVTPTVYGGGYQFRYQGYMSAMASKGLPVRELRTTSEPLGEIAAYRYFLNMEKPLLEAFDGFVCECDETAIGLIAALKDRGYQVPGDFSVVGYDGLPGVSKDLTTIIQDPHDIAEKVSELLEAAMAGELPRGAMIPVTLKQGKSS